MSVEGVLNWHTSVRGLLLYSNTEWRILLFCKVCCLPLM